MQALLASLVVSMGVKDAAFKAGMSTARAEAKKTGQEFDRSADTMGRAIQRAANQVNDAAIRMVDSLGRAGKRVRDVGIGMTVGLTLPLGLTAKAAKQTASDFQAAMNNVHAAMLDASPKELDALREAALRLGPAMGKSAIETAGAIESLAKNGMSAAGILSGGLQSALKLGVLGQTDLGKAADATTDILQQFHLTTGALPDVVDKVSGALDASKLDFNGYADAIGMVGGIAGGLGYSFDDMNTALAAVIPLMTGGSDAGTSFKTFLLSLVPQSKDAAGVMDKLGISFKNADGSMKTLSEAAELLNTKMSGLSNASRQDALTKMFGTDGMRVALALMQAGAKGIADVQAQIDKASADGKIAILMDGEAAATQRLAGAWEKLKIAIGSAGLVQAFTLIKNAGASLIGALGSMPSWFYTAGLAIGGMVAMTGPLIIAMTTLAKFALPLLALRLGPIGLGLAAIINPAGVVLRLLGALAVRAGAGMIIARLGTAMLGFAGPVGIAVTVLTMLIPLLFRKAQASGAAQAAVDAATAADQKATEVTEQLATATGKARLEILAKAKADRVAAVAAVVKANADMAAARATYVRAKADAQRSSQLAAAPADSEGGIGVVQTAAQKRYDKAAADFQASIDATSGQNSALAKLNTAIRSAQAPSSPKVDMSFEDEKKDRTKKGPKGKTAEDRAREAAQYADELGRLKVEELRAQGDLTDGVQARYRAEMASIAEERASYLRSLAIDTDKTEAQKAALAAQQDATLSIRRQIAEQDRTIGLAQQNHDMLAAQLDAEEEAVRATTDIADSIAGRREGEMRLLDIQRRKEEADLDLILATKNSASAEWANASARKDALAGVYQARAEQVSRQNEGPGAAYMRTLNRSAANISEAVQSGGVGALQDLNSELVSAGFNVGKLGNAFTNMGKRILSTLAEIAIQQMLIKPMATALFGANTTSGGGEGSGGGGLFGSILGGLRSLAGLSKGAGLMSSAKNLPTVNIPTMPDWSSGIPINPGFGGARATGGGINDNEWYWVGERGPEKFYPGMSGTVVPNEGRGDRPQAQPAVVQVAVEEGSLFRPTIQQVSGSVAIETTTARARADARARSRRLR